MYQKTHLLALAVFSSLPLLGHAQQCATGYTPATLTGHVTTLNVSETKQVGQLCMLLKATDGRELFNDCGALVGKVTATNTTTGASTLNHTAVFELLESFQTYQDAAQITGVLDTDDEGAACAFSVTEQLTRLKWGTGIFSGATVNVIAEGSISFCPGKNLNTFQLNGQACVRSKRR